MATFSNLFTLLGSFTSAKKSLVTLSSNGCDTHISWVEDVPTARNDHVVIELGRARSSGINSSSLLKQINKNFSVKKIADKFNS